MLNLRQDRRIPDFILLILLQQPSHGFDLHKRINKIQRSNKVDSAGVYRALDKLDKEKMVSYVWLLGDKGPNKKLYSITKLGENYLHKAYENAMNTIFYLNIFTETYNGIMLKKRLSP